MALKFISLADLLSTRGDGGVRGDNGCRANVRAGVVIPLTSKQASPLLHAGGERGASRITGGEARSQHPCGFQATDPTVPADPASFEAMACPSSFDDIGWPINTDLLVGACHVLDLAQGQSEFKTAMNSDEFHPRLDDSPDAFSAQELAGRNVETPVALADPMAWQALKVVYHAHHYSCPTCIAAGRGLMYGERCAPGLLLWNAYQE